MNFKQTALKAAKAAGKIQLKYFGEEIKKSRKEDDSYVTKADLECSKEIRKILTKAFPTHNIMDEESEYTDNKSDYTWIVDPIDGTHNFMMESPLFGVSIALEYKKEIILGVVYMPYLKKMYSAVKGKGTYCNNKRLKVNNETNLNKCLMIFDSNFRTNTNTKIRILRKMTKKTWRLRSYGAAIYHNLLVAEGHAGINIDFGSHPWDHSAVHLMVEEAGGKVTELNGKKWSSNTKDYVATNGKVHDKVLSVIGK